MKDKAIPTMIHLYESQREALARIAKQQGTTWAAIVRSLIDNHLR